MRPDAQKIAEALKGKPTRNGYMCCCPAHDDRTPSLSVKESDDGNVLLHCFAGCQFVEIISELKNMGLWPDWKEKDDSYNYKFRNRTDMPDPGKLRDGVKPVSILTPKGYLKKKEKREHSYTMEDVLTLWCACIDDTQPIHEYMKSRGISDVAPYMAKYHPTKNMMVNPILGSDGSIIGLHRTFLSPDHEGKRKKIFGNALNGYIEVAKGDDEMSSDIAISEGIENGAAWHAVTGMHSISSVFSGNLRNIDNTILPIFTRNIHLIEDHDLEDKQGKINSMRMYDEAVAKWLSMGYNVYRHHPDVEQVFGSNIKADWLDVYNENPYFLEQSSKFSELLSSDEGFSL